MVLPPSRTPLRNATLSSSLMRTASASSRDVSSLFRMNAASRSSSSHALGSSRQSAPMCASSVMRFVLPGRQP